MLKNIFKIFVAQIIVITIIIPSFAFDTPINAARPAYRRATIKNGSKRRIRYYKRVNARRTARPAQNTTDFRGQSSPVPVSSPNPVGGNSANNLVSPSANEKTSDPVEAMTTIKGGNLFFPVKDITPQVMTLGIAPRGVIVIEYPADDPIYQIHPGDENYVSVSCTTTAPKNDKSDEASPVECKNSPYDAMILRPGSEMFKDDASEKSTLITVIRQSGMVFTFLVSPVKSVSKNANHVFVSYNTAQMIEGRKKAGLSYEMGKAKINPAKTVQSSALPKNTEPNSESVAPKILTVSAKTDPLEQQTLQMLNNRVQSNAKLDFTKAVYGLSLAVFPNTSRVNAQAVDVVAVKNTLNVPVRLLNEQPTLYLETTSDKGAVESKPVAIRNLATTVLDDDILQPGKTYYFAFLYDSPLLGSRQKLKISFAQTNATDAPATIDLQGIAR